MAEKEDLNELTVDELRDRASELEITGGGSMDKAELVTAIEDAEGPNARAIEARASAAEPHARGADSSEPKSDADDDKNVAADISAPSIGPNTVIHNVPPEERLDHDKISDVDAMGLDKRREVQGKRYGASPAKQLAVYGTFLVVVAALGFGGKMLADKLDEPPETVAVDAPWAQPGVKQIPPAADLDYPRSTND